jgi:hypothetical protein
MTEDLLDYWIRLIKPLFPAHAWIVARVSDEDYLIQIDWNLEKEARRLNQRSKKIQITIASEAIEAYLDKSKKEREVSDSTLKKLILDRYQDVSPDQNVRANQTASVEKWLISGDVLNKW